MSEKDEKKLDKVLSELSVPGLRDHLDKVLSELQRRRESEPPEPTSSVQGLVMGGYIEVAMNLYMRQNPKVDRSDVEKLLRKYQK